MSWRVIFDGVDQYGQLDSNITLGDGDTFSCGFRSRLATDGKEHWLVGDAGATDGIRTKGTANGSEEFYVEIGGITYDNNLFTTDLYDGEDHTIEVTRDGSDFDFVVDGAAFGTITAVATGLDVIVIARDGTSGTQYAPVELSNMVIGDSTYPMANMGTDTIIDTSVSGNDITLYNAPAWGFVSSWEWIGDLSTVEREYSVPNGLFSEARSEGVRRRIVKGYDTGIPLNKQLGESSATVTALNGGTTSTLYPATGGTELDCEEEKFTPLTGTNIFWQSQKWVNWVTSTS